MDLSTLKPAKGSVKVNKRVGRGAGSGWGGTAGRGHKGAQSRSGYKVKAGFEGGQMPLQRRVPKFGFKSPHKIYFSVLNLDRLQTLVEQLGKDSLTLDDFQSHGLIGKNDKLKILGGGELTSKVEVSAHAFSQSAVQAIEAAGGKVNKL